MKLRWQLDHRRLSLLEISRADAPQNWIEAQQVKVQRFVQELLNMVWVGVEGINGVELLVGVGVVMGLNC